MTFRIRTVFCLNWIKGAKRKCDDRCRPYEKGQSSNFVHSNFLITNKSNSFFYKKHFLIYFFLATIFSTDMADDGSKLRRRTHLPRDSQGIVRLQWLENFFETLYSSNQRINIPYTVVFQYRRIYAAYFTDSDGYVQKIDKIADLGPDQVMEGLKASSSKISMPRAYYIYSKKSEEPFSDQNQDLSIEYFDDASLAHFLTYRSKENNGILQQFLEPATLNVSSIRAYWTPYFCQLETRMNVHRADDVHIPIQRRAVTFEGEHHHSQPFPLSSKLEGRVNDVVQIVVQNVKHVLPSNVGIQIMMLNFKIGSGGKIWFLYCNSIKLYDQSNAAIGYGRDSIGVRPGSAKLVEASIPPPGFRGSKKRHGLVCVSSETRLGPFDKYKITVQQVFCHFLWHGPTKAWIKLNRSPPTIDLEFGQDPDPSGGLCHILRVFLTMDLRLSPLGLPFLWNAPLDKASSKEKDVTRWSHECKEAHSKLERKIDELLVVKHDLKSMYRYWETTMVYLISQEIESLTLENFQQVFKRSLRAVWLVMIRKYALRNFCLAGKNQAWIPSKWIELL